VSSLLDAFEEEQAEVLPSSALFVRREPVVKAFDLYQVEASVSMAEGSDSRCATVPESKTADRDDYIVTALMACALLALFFSFFLL
jgi:hypothetical protein